MKEFIDEYNKIEYKLIDTEGKEKIIQSKPLTIEKQFEMKKIVKNKKLSVAEKLSMQITLIFGGDHKEYFKYSLQFLADILVDYQKEITKVNPIEEAKSKISQKKLD